MPEHLMMFMSYLLIMFKNYFALFFVVMWLAVSVSLGVMSGWYRLMERFPDQAAEPILRLRGQSGRMGRTHMGGVLTLSVCPFGLRIGIMRIFGPFCRDFFVPWDSIAVIRKTALFGQVAELRFGNPVVGTLSIPSHIAARLAYAASGRWPEAGPFPEETRSDTFRRLLRQWALMTCLAAVFFIVAPFAVGPSGARPEILPAILFPAIGFAVLFMVRFLIERR